MMLASRMLPSRSIRPCCQMLVHQGKHDLAQAMALQKMTKIEDGGLIGQGA